MSLPNSSDHLFFQETNAFVEAVIQGLQASDWQLERIKQEQEQDDVCNQIKVYCRDSWPAKHELTGAIRLYYPVLAEITEENGLLMQGSRLVIPPSMRLEILDKLHTGHQGITKCRE